MVDQSNGGTAGAAGGGRVVSRRAVGRGRAGRRPVEVAFLFANPPLAPGEDASDWEALCDSLADALRPASVIDWLRLRDVACGVWDALRMERYRDALLRLERGRAAADVLASLLADRIDDATTRERAARSIARGWLAGRTAEKREMSQALSSAGIDEATLVAGAFMAQLDTHERIERMRRRAEEARDAALAAFGPARPLATRPRDIVIEAEVEAEVVEDTPAERAPKPRSRAARTAVREGMAVREGAGADEAPKRPPRGTPDPASGPAAAPNPQADLFG